MKGAVACMQGYAARLGLGITLNKNQVVARNPRIKKSNPGGIFLAFRDNTILLNLFGRYGKGWYIFTFLIIAKLAGLKSQHILYFFNLHVPFIGV